MPVDILANYPFPLTRSAGDDVESELLRLRAVCAGQGTVPVINQFHLLVRVPHRPEGFDVPLELVVARLE
jgi:hypothetical protein